MAEGSEALPALTLSTWRQSGVDCRDIAPPLIELLRRSLHPVLPEMVQTKLLSKAQRMNTCSFFTTKVGPRFAV